jgi:hypothetical protein
MNSNDVHVGLQLPRATRDQIAQLAREHDRSFSAEVRRVIALHPAP